MLLINKTATRMPEAMFFVFDPLPAGAASWTVDKLGEWIAPDEVMVGGSPHLHAVSSGACAVCACVRADGLQACKCCAGTGMV